MAEESAMFCKTQNFQGFVCVALQPDDLEWVIHPLRVSLIYFGSSE
jgi:hypothetical protein